MQIIHRFIRNTVGFTSGFIFLVTYCTIFGKSHSDVTLMNTPVTVAYTLKMLLALLISCLILHWASKGIKPVRKDESILDLFIAFIVVALSSFAGLVLTFFVCQFIG